MQFFVFYRNSLRDSYDNDPPKVDVPFTHVATLEFTREFRAQHHTMEQLETIFRVMNVVDGSDMEVPQKIRNRSMSVGDVAVDATGRAWVVASCGFEAVSGDFKASQGTPTFTV